MRGKSARNSSWNLLLFGLLLLVLLGTYVIWHHHRQRVELARLAQVAASQLEGSAPPPALDGSHPCIYALVSDGAAEPALGRCSTPTSHTDPVDRFEVDLRYGAFVLRQTDLEIDDVFNVPLTRSYTSDDWLPQNTVHAFGRNSNHPYDIAPLGARNPYSYMVLALEDGDLLYFKRVTAGTGYADAVFQHTETSTRFYKSVIYWNGDGWTLQLKDGSKMFFPESYGARNLAQGAAMEIRDASGNVLRLLRDQTRNLREIETPHGHWIRFTYDNQFRITKATDDQGHSVAYDYSADHNGMLLSAICSSGKERHYQYQGTLMTAVLDGHGHLLLRNTYRSGVVVRQVYGNGEIYEYKYVLGSTGTYAEKVIVTLPSQKQEVVEVGNSVPEDLRK